MANVTIEGVSMDVEAARNVEASGADVAGDVAKLRSGELTRETLLAHCLDGADPECVQGWHDYVSAVYMTAIGLGARASNERAIANGIEDAQTWMDENPDRDDWQKAVAPGALGADEALINAMGSAFVAKLFGVENESAEYSAACGDYSKAWCVTVLEALETNG